MSDKSSNEIRALIQRAKKFEKNTDWLAAVEAYRDTLPFSPLDAEIWHRIGVCLCHVEKHEDAIQFLEKSALLDPGNIDYQLRLGDALFFTRRLKEAIAAYSRVQELDPNNASAANNIGVALQEGGLLDDAIHAIGQALYLAPGDPLVKANMGSALLKLGKIEDALTALESAVRQDPSHAEAWSNYGVALQEDLQLEAAIDAHQTAIRLAPENHQLHYNFSMALLLCGKFELGFDEFEHRNYIPNLKPREFTGKCWTGEDILGKTLLVHAEQGVGDTIQFSRFIRVLSDAGAKIIFSTHSSLVELMGAIDAPIQVVSGNDLSGQYDYKVPLLSLAHRTGLYPSEVEFPNSSYLSVPNGTFCPVPSSAAKPRIGLVWAGNPRHSNDKNRSCSLENFRPLFDLDEIDWFSLQVGESSKEIEKKGFPVIDISDKLENFSITAATIEALDLIVSVDTAAIHLAGALGKPAWCLLSYSPDWRWQIERLCSPWYPSLRLYRQTSRGDWDGVIRKICTDLQTIFL